jgi:hypothetical protein
MGIILSRVESKNPWLEDDDASFAGEVKAAAFSKKAGESASTTKQTEAVAAATALTREEGRLGVKPLPRRIIEEVADRRVAAEYKRYHI